MKVTIEGKGKNQELVIRIPVNTDLPLSKSGKTRIVASSNGNVATTATMDDFPVIVGLNAYIPLPRK